MEPTSVPTTVITTSAKCPNEFMTAIEWNANKDIRVNAKHQKPDITQPTDAIVKIIATSICGTDLGLYHKETPDLKVGDILGHEGYGIVEKVGEKVTKIKPGQHVVISPVLACGGCEYCQKQLYGCCDVTNPNTQQEELYGHRTCGILGHPSISGGYEGTQAEYIRIPFAEFNLLQIPEDLSKSLGQENLVLLSDVIPTAWQANESGDVSQGDIVGIWGAGPVGLATAIFAKYRGASRVIVIDSLPSRLNFAREVIGAEIINYNEDKDIVKKLKQVVPGGLDVGIDCVGHLYSSKTVKHTVEKALGMETDSIEVIDEAIKCVRKGGRLSIIAAYSGVANHFPIGGIFQKSLTVSASICQVQKYWQNLLEVLRDEKISNQTKNLYTHTMKLTDTPKAYRMFDNKEEGMIKVLLKAE